MGCMAQNLGDDLVDRLPDLDLIVGTQKFHRLPDYLDQLLASHANGNDHGAKPFGYRRGNRIGKRNP